MAKVSLVQGGKKVVGGSNAGTYTYDKTSGSYNKNPAGEVLGVATDQKYAGASLKDLSIGLANDNAQRTQESSMLKDLSVGLAQGKNITQNKINSARSSGGSLLGSTSTTRTGGASPLGGNNPTSNQTAVGGGKKFSRYGVYGEEEPVLEEPSYEEISKQLMREAQKEVNSLYKYQNSLLQDQKTVNDENLRQNAAVNTLTGLAGSSEANVTTKRVQTQNQQADQKIRDQVNVQIQGVLSNVRKDAQQMYQFERQQYNVDMATAEKMRTEMYTKAVTNTTMLAQSGATAEGYKQTDPEGYAYLAQQLGGEEVLKSMFTLNRPQDKILDKKIEGGKYVIAFQNPIDGKIRIESVDLGLPPQYTKTVDAGDRILAIPDDWDGDPSNLITINKGLTPSQAAGGGGGAGGSGAQYGSDLDAIIGATESIITSKFGQETFRNQIARARNDGDKINLVASVVLGKADSATKTDFANQAVGINQIDKAIKLLDEGVKTGVLEAGAQYAYNIVGQDFDPNLAKINQLITSAIQPYRNSVTGAAWGTQEDGEYQMLFGSSKYSPTELRQRLEGVKEILASKSANALNAYVNPMGYYDNPFQSGGNGQSQSGQLRGPDGQLYDASALTPQEYQDALAEGYQPA